MSFSVFCNKKCEEEEEKEKRDREIERKFFFHFVFLLTLFIFLEQRKKINKACVYKFYVVVVMI